MLRKRINSKRRNQSPEYIACTMYICTMILLPSRPSHYFIRPAIPSLIPASFYTSENSKLTSTVHLVSWPPRSNMRTKTHPCATYDSRTAATAKIGLREKLSSLLINMRRKTNSLSSYSHSSTSFHMGSVAGELSLCMKPVSLWGL